MQRENDGLGGSFSVEGDGVEVDMASFGWDPEARKAAGIVEEVDEDFAEFSSSASSASAAEDEEGTERLQKALAGAGVASRRACETLITSGRVKVNGKVATELGSRINPATDEVRVDGVVVQLDVSKRYFVLNKPEGVVSTMSDEHDRPDLRQFTDQIDDRLYNVGRLDTDTSGLLILTNDGELANKLAHPSFGVSKTYVAKVRGRITASVIQQLKDGIELKDGPIHADRARILAAGGPNTKNSLVELTLHSGRNRIVRRMLAEVGFPVLELVRRQFGPLNLGSMRVGEMRELAPAERGALLSTVDENGAPVSARKRVTAGRPGDGKGAKGMRGVAARGNPHGRRGSSDDRREYPGERDSQGSRDELGGYQKRDAHGGFQKRDGSFHKRDERGGYGGRDDRGGYQGRDDRQGGGRGGYEKRDGGFDSRGGERGGYPKRDSRDGFQKRDDRGGYGDRDNRGGYPKRDGGFQGGRDGGRDDRGARGGYEKRDGGFDSRGGERGGYPKRDSRDGYQKRDDRGGFGDRDNRGGDRGERGGYQKRDGGYPKRDGGFQGGRDGGRDDRGARGGHEKRDGGQGRGGYGDRDNRGGYQGRDDRQGGGRGGFESRGGERGGYPKRDGGFQGGRDDRGARGGFEKREDRGGYPKRDGGYQSRDNRGGYGDRDNRGGDRGGYQGRNDDRGGNRGGYQGRNDRQGGGRGGFEKRDGGQGRGGYQGNRDNRGGSRGRDY